MMCTALSFKTKDHYFGRTLDLDITYGEKVCIVPRNFSFKFRHVKEIKQHSALVGMAMVVDNMPLFYDAANEDGLAIAGLNFPGNAYYNEIMEDKDNICQFELIPWILCNCKTVEDAKKLLVNINIVNTSFSENLKPTPLHWIISDKDKSIVVEQVKPGLNIYDNPVGVLTNNPPFNYQMFNLNNYRNLKINNGQNSFSANLHLKEYCQGLGSLGLPGDVSSMSRFVRTAFNKENSVIFEDEMSSVGQFFHILSSVEMIKGVCEVMPKHYDITIYTSCMNTTKGIYYYTTYGNRQINAVMLHNIDLDSFELKEYPLINSENVNYQN